MHDGPSPILEWADGEQYPAYLPVDWLIDRTPLRQPLFWWAGLFGLRDEFELAHALRTGRLML
jgi:hypothetical protein